MIRSGEKEPREGKRLGALVSDFPRSSFSRLQEQALRESRRSSFIV